MPRGGGGVSLPINKYRVLAIKSLYAGTTCMRQKCALHAGDVPDLEKHSREAHLFRWALTKMQDILREEY